MKVDSNILGFTIPYLLEQCKEQTKRLVHENTENSKYTGPSPIVWKIICGVGRHSNTKNVERTFVENLL